MSTALQGRTFKYGNDIDTDIIAPIRFLMTTDPKELAKAAFADYDPDFQKTVQSGDVVVAGTNFGCGSSREHAPICLKANGVSCVIAENFARIFFRNAINIGLPVLECAEAVQGIDAGDEVAVDMTTGMIRNLTKGQSWQAKAIPSFMMEIFTAGGLVNYTRQRLAAGEAGA